MERRPSLVKNVDVLFALKIITRTSRFSDSNNLGIKSRWEIRHIQENANPGKYVGCKELNVSL